jgi:HSP20 family molecular chaperone IbpA
MSQLNVQKVPDAEDRSLPVFAELERLAERIRLQAYNLFARRGSGAGHALDDWLAAEREVCWPSAELAEREGEYAVKVALAGFEPSEIDVTATPREIIVRAAHKHEKKSAADAKLQWSEFRSDEVFRRIELPAEVNVSKVAATLENGLLEIKAPKAEQKAAPAKKVAVSAKG